MSDESVAPHENEPQLADLLAPSARPVRPRRVVTAATADTPDSVDVAESVDSGTDAGGGHDVLTVGDAEVKDTPADTLPIGARLLQWAVQAGVKYWPVYVAMGVGLVIRLMAVNVWMPPCTPQEAAARTRVDECYAVGGDAYYYNSMASNLAAGEGFTILNLYTLENQDKADHPPGYVIFLATLDKAGIEKVQEHRTVLAYLGIVTVGLIGLLGHRLGGKRPRITAGLAAGLAAIYPGFWMSEVLYMSESFFLPFIALSLLCAYRFWRVPTMRNSVFLGAAAGMAWLTRGEAALILGFMCVGFVLFFRGVGFWRRVALGAVSCAVCVALMVPWVAYNLNRFPEPILIAGTGTAFALNSCDDVWYGDAAGFYSFGCLTAYSNQAIAEDGELTDAGLNRVARAYIRENISYYPSIMGVRVGRLYGVYNVNDTLLRNIAAEGRRESWVQWQQQLYYVFLVGLPFGLFSLWRRKLPLTPIVATIAAVGATVAQAFAIYRYRLAADTAMLVAASVGFVAAIASGKEWLLSQWALVEHAGPATPTDAIVADATAHIVEPDPSLEAATGDGAHSEDDAHAPAGDAVDQPAVPVAPSSA